MPPLSAAGAALNCLRGYLLLRPRILLHGLHTEPLALDITHPTYVIWGSNTGVGKTLVSTGLAASALSSSSVPSTFVYVKPIQTGFPSDSDARFLYLKLSRLYPCHSHPLFASNHAVHASTPASSEILGNQSEESLGGSCWYEEARVGGRKGEEKGARLICKTLYGWRKPISPHLAVEREGMVVEDGELREMLKRCLELGKGGSFGEDAMVWRVVETAGGVASPGPSGTLQCDLYRPFRLPAVLVGDGRLGGISATISAYESLKLRGYDIAAVILLDHGLSNEEPLLSYLRNSVDVLVLPPVPEDQSDDLMDWFCESSKVFNALHLVMLSAHSKRIQRLHEMPKKAKEIFWWPFTQHQLVPEKSVTVIDSRCGENFAVHKVRSCREMIIPQFDACASWWTQGPDTTLQIELARDMGYSTARYGHVMFPENVYEPALRCAELLLEGVGKGWASRTYYSDNGSTAIEIALKMAFRKFAHDHGICLDAGKGTAAERYIDFRVLALNGSYHGDTLGAMEAQAPSSYTGLLQQPWYSGRGFFLDPPTIFISNKSWTLSLPDVLLSTQQNSQNLRFESCEELFSQIRDSSALARSYASYISKELSQLSESRCATHIGALIIEPVIHGAGGMHMIDPLFQRVLARECQIHKIPVIFDEVFAGFWRLGRESAAELLGCYPDIACYGKLLTGGVVPLAVTLATEAVFEAFNSDSKLLALLHGHSYSAHALGCTAAAKAIQWFKDPHSNANINIGGMKMRELWDTNLVLEISSLQAVRRIISMGTVCAIELRTEGSDAGYASLYATSLIQQLREDGVYTRPLGNVIYFMCGPCTPPHICNQQLSKVYQKLGELSLGQNEELKSVQK